MTTTTATTAGPTHISSISLLRAALVVLALAGVLAVAFVLGRITHSDGTHLVRSITTSAYWPQVACHVGRPC